MNQKWVGALRHPTRWRHGVRILLDYKTVIAHIVNVDDNPPSLSTRWRSNDNQRRKGKENKEGKERPERRQGEGPSVSVWH